MADCIRSKVSLARSCASLQAASRSRRASSACLHPARLLDGLVGEELAHGGVDLALGQRGRHLRLLERRVRQVAVRAQRVEGTLGALDGGGEGGRGVEHRVVEHALPVGGVAGRAVVLHGAGGCPGRLVGEELRDVGLADLVGLPPHASPVFGEGVPAPHAPDGVDQLTGRAAQVRAPAEPLADEADRSGRELRERFRERVHLAAGGLLHLLELRLESGELAGLRAELADLIRDLRDLVDDHLGPLDRAGDRAKIASAGSALARISIGARRRAVRVR